MIRTKAPEGTVWFVGPDPETFGTVPSIMLFPDGTFLHDGAMRLPFVQGQPPYRRAKPLATEALEFEMMSHQWYIEVKARKVKRRYLNAQRAKRRRARIDARRELVIRRANSHLKVEGAE